MKLTARDFALMSYGDAWRNALKGDGLSQEQRRVLDFVCAKSRGGLPAHYTRPCIGRMFGCRVEKVQEVFEFLEHRHLIYRHEKWNGRKTWARFTEPERRDRCGEVLMQQTPLLSELCGAESAAACCVLSGHWTGWRDTVDADYFVKWGHVRREAALHALQCCEQCGLMEQVEPGHWKRTWGSYETYERWFGERGE